MNSNKASRIVAIIGLILIALDIVFFIYCAFTGNNFFPALALLVILPVIIWAFLFFAGKFDSKNDDN